MKEAKRNPEDALCASRAGRAPQDPAFAARVQAEALKLRQEMDTRDWRLLGKRLGGPLLADDVKDLLTRAFTTMMDDCYQAAHADPPIASDYFYKIREMVGFIRSRDELAAHPQLETLGNDERYEVATRLLGSVIKRCAELGRTAGLPHAGVNILIVKCIDKGKGIVQSEGR